jgi:hypothetical protein
MRPRVVLFACLLTYFGTVNAQFQRSYGTSSFEDGRSIDLGQDFGYVIAGETSFPFLGRGDAYLSKIDNNGNLLWANVYGREQFDQFNTVRRLTNTLATSPVAYIAAGYSGSFGLGAPGSHDMYLVGTDPNGIPIFSRVYGGKGVDKIWNAELINDPIDGPGYILVGETNSFNLTANLSGVNVFVVRTDLMGNLKDAAVFGTKFTDRGYWIEQTSDKNYIITGYTTAKVTTADSTLNPNIMVLKIDRNLNLLWDRIIGGAKPLDDIAYCIKEIGQGTTARYILTGYTRNFGIGGGDAFLMALDPNGNFVWMKSYGGTNPDQGNVLLAGNTVAGAQGLVVAGYSNSFSPTPDALVFSTDINGNLFWGRTYGGAKEDFFYDMVAQTASPAGGFATTGLTASLSSTGTDDIYAVGLNMAGSTGTPCEKVVDLRAKVCQPLLTKGFISVKMGEQLVVQSAFKPVQMEVLACGVTTPPNGREGIQENTFSLPNSSNGVSVVPNPVTGSSLSLVFPENLNGGNARIFHTNGQVAREFAEVNSGTVLFVEDLEAGIYMIQMTGPTGETKTSKFIKK